MVFKVSLVYSFSSYLVIIINTKGQDCTLIIRSVQSECDIKHTINGNSRNVRYTYIKEIQ